MDLMRNLSFLCGDVTLFDNSFLNETDRKWLDWPYACEDPLK